MLLTPARGESVTWPEILRLSESGSIPRLWHGATIMSGFARVKGCGIQLQNFSLGQLLRRPFLRPYPVEAGDYFRFASDPEPDRQQTAGWSVRPGDNFPKAELLLETKLFGRLEMKFKFTFYETRHRFLSQSTVSVTIVEWVSGPAAPVTVIV